MKCYSCRKSGIPGWPGPRDLCCGPLQVEDGWTIEGEAGPPPDVAQWLRTRAIRVAWLVNARRHVPGLTVGRSAS